MNQTEPETIKAAKKAHICSWCGEKIDAGETYIRYRWFSADGASVVKEHPECYDAMNEVIDLDGEIEFGVGEHPRGCNCGRDAGCPRCAKEK